MSFPAQRLQKVLVLIKFFTFIEKMGIHDIYACNCLPMTSVKNELTLNKSVVFSVSNISCCVQGCAHSSGRFHHTSLLRHTVQLQQP